MSEKDIKPNGRKTNIVVQDYGKEILVYDLTENKAFNLNETSARIWQMCDGNNCVSQIAVKLSHRFNSAVSEDFVWLALEQLKTEDLLENPKDVLPDFNGLSRREVIRKVGLATLIALPIISSLVAPAAIHAASTCSTAAPGGTQCRCDCSVARNSTCGTGLTADFCNPGCTCTRTAVSCYSGADPGLANTALGACS